MFNIRDVVRLHETELLRIPNEKLRLRRMVELNVIAQVRNLAKTNLTGGTSLYHLAVC